MKSITTTLAVSLLLLSNPTFAQSMLSQILKPQPALTAYSCPDGFTLEGTLCKKRNIVPATPIYSCAEGETLSGSVCIKKIIKSEPAKATYNCPEGFILKDKLCTKQVNDANQNRPK